jgi:anionic cell wall polymer biosynthesis LytR-Cps2A-Psr (LCP) family protein
MNLIESVLLTIGLVSLIALLFIHDHDLATLNQKIERQEEIIQSLMKDRETNNTHIRVLAKNQNAIKRAWNMEHNSHLDFMAEVGE